MISSCPLCNSIDIGKVGSNQYYCWNCCIEFRMMGDKKYKYYNIETDGTLSVMGEESY